MSSDNPIPINDRFRGFLPVVVDVETGGFNHKRDALLEVGAVIIAMNSKGELYPDKTLFYRIEPFPGANIEESALEFTGIDPFHPFRMAEIEEDALPELFTEIRQAKKFNNCSRAVLVGHNAAFDHNFLFAAADRCNIKRNPFHPFSMFDTVSLAALAYGQTVLAKSCIEAGIEFDNDKAHSAKYDAVKTAELFCDIMNRWKYMSENSSG
ncbi:MAG: ribonuclease T [Pseudomonadales bacterium]|nr:ribonuclease T [Pseudomonadales bacterium]